MYNNNCHGIRNSEKKAVRNSKKQRQTPYAQTEEVCPFLACVSYGESHLR